MRGATTGVALMARILAEVAEAEPRTGAGLAHVLAAARATSFGVLRDLEAAGLVVRDGDRLVLPGASAAALGFAAFGLGPLAGAAATLLSGLRDDTDGTAELVAIEAGREIVLLLRQPAGWAMPARAEVTVLDSAVASAPGLALVRLHLRAPLPEQREAARRSLAAVAGALSRTLEAAQGAR